MLRNPKLIFIFLLILLSAAIIRLTNLATLPIFADEAIYVRWAQVMHAESTLRFLPLSDGKQPLFMWATIPFLKLFTDPLIAGRFVSALSGILTVCGVAFASYILFKDKKLAIVAAIVWSVVPFAVFFERMALADALLCLLIVWGFNFCALSLQHLRWDYAMLAGFSWGFAWLTKSPAMFALCLSPLLILLTDKKITLQVLVKSLALLATTFTIAFAMYNILRLGPEFYMIALRNQDYLIPISEVLRHPLDPLIPHLKDVLTIFWYLFTPIGSLFIFWGIFDPRKIHLRPRLIVASWLIIPLVAEAFMAKSFTARYLLFTAPFAAILIAHAINHLGQKTWKHVLLVGSTILLVIPSLWMDKLLVSDPQNALLPQNERSGYLEEWTAGFGIKSASEIIADAAKNGPVVVGSEGFFGTPFSALEMYLNNQTNVRVVGVGIDINSVDQKLTNALKDNQVFLVVNSTRFKIKQPEKFGLTLINSYQKALRTDGSREYLLLFKLNSV